jgi:hypothetical protein
MPGTDPPCPTGLRALTRAGDATAVRAEMASALPEGGLAASRLTHDRLLTATYRLLDSQILTAAVGCLDQDIGTPVAEWLAGYQELRTAAAETLADPEQTRSVLFKKPYRLDTAQTSDIVLRVHEKEIADFPFTLEISLELGETSVTVRRGAIEEVECVAATVSGSLTFADVSPPLWRRTASTSALRLPIRPPVHVPLVPVPRPATDGRRTTAAARD